MKTLVIGLGNPILSDDGVGVLVAHAVANALLKEPTHDVTVGEASVGGLRLMEMMVGYERVILIDALLDNTTPLGTIHRLTLDDLRAISPTQHSASAHDTTLTTALDSGRRMGLPLPADVVIFGISVQNVVDFCDQPTPPVAAAIPQVTETVLAELSVAEAKRPSAIPTAS
jgi:hydrogenase maturation protease